jgi:hypothetical protein
MGIKSRVRKKRILMGQFTSEWHISDEKLQMSTDEIISDFGLAKNDQLSWLVGKGNRKKQTKIFFISLSKMKLFLINL